MRKVTAVPAVFLGLALLTVVVAAATAQARSEKAQVTTVTLSGWSSGRPRTTSSNRSSTRSTGRTRPIQIDYSVIQGDYPVAMTARFAAQNPPDVFYVDSSKLLDVGEAGRAPAAEQLHQGEQVRHEQVHPGSAQCVQGREERSTGSRRTGRRSRWRSTGRCYARPGPRSRPDLGRATHDRPEDRIVERGARTASRSACPPTGRACSRSSSRTRARSRTCSRRRSPRPSTTTSA